MSQQYNPDTLTFKGLLLLSVTLMESYLIGTNTRSSYIYELIHFRDRPPCFHKDPVEIDVQYNTCHKCIMPFRYINSLTLHLKHAH